MVDGDDERQRECLRRRSVSRPTRMMRTRPTNDLYFVRYCVSYTYWLLPVCCTVYALCLTAYAPHATRSRNRTPCTPPSRGRVSVLSTLSVDARRTAVCLCSNTAHCTLAWRLAGAAVGPAARVPDPVPRPRGQIRESPHWTLVMTLVLTSLMTLPRAEPERKALR